MYITLFLQSVINSCILFMSGMSSRSWLTSNARVRQHQRLHCHTCPRCSHHSRSVAGSALSVPIASSSSSDSYAEFDGRSMMTPSQYSFMLSSRVLLTITSACLLVHQRRRSTSCSESWMQLHVSSPTPGSLTAVWRSFNVTFYIGWTSLMASRSDCASRLSVLTRHGAIVPVRTVSVGFGVWRTSSSAVFGPQSTRRTSLPSCNHR